MFRFWFTAEIFCIQFLNGHRFEDIVDRIIYRCIEVSIIVYSDETVSKIRMDKNN